jgi:hypothetical protein
MLCLCKLRSDRLSVTRNLTGVCLISIQEFKFKPDLASTFPQIGLNRSQKVHKHQNKYPEIVVQPISEKKLKKFTVFNSLFHFKVAVIYVNDINNKQIYVMCHLIYN